MPRAAAKSLEQLAAVMADDERFVHIEKFPARAARYAQLATPLPEHLNDLIPENGLWSHQVEAINALRANESSVIATGTASGKSLCYQLPIAEAVSSSDKPATALLLFPTKALAQDQLRALSELDVDGLIAATYDGDSSYEERTWVRSHANVILTNPEMLHISMLPVHAKWGNFFKRLRYVVIDELHVLRGMFGSNVAHVIRRLRRLCEHYGSSPTFFFTSATIGQPQDLASQLCGLDVRLIDNDGSPKGERLFVLWDPGADGEAAAEGRSFSSSKDTAEVMSSLIKNGHTTLSFCRSRKGTELVAADVQRRVSKKLAESVRAYRGGYLRSERREIESELFSGKLKGVIATSALELGIDVGGLDACVLNGFPGTVASMWQQAGRVGRSGNQSLCVVVAGDDQLDHWFLQHPDELFSRSPEPVVINPTNPYVLLPQVACAAYELPLTDADEKWWPDVDEVVRDLVLDDKLRIRPARTGAPAGAVWSGRGRPADSVSLRSANVGEVRIATDDGTLIGTVDWGRAFRLVHPGAIYLHQGVTWRVSELRLDEQVAIVESFNEGEYTQPRTNTDITILQVEDSINLGRFTLHHGIVKVETDVIGYRRIDQFSGEQLGMYELDLPTNELVTKAFWYAIDDDIITATGLDRSDLLGSLHAIEHAAIGLLPLIAVCDRWDVGGLSTNYLEGTGCPTVVIHDAYPGGGGIAEMGFASGRTHLERTLAAISSCACEDGCPSCIQSPKCGNGNSPLSKSGAIALLSYLVDVDE